MDKMNIKGSKERFEAVYQLLSGDSTNLEKFESIRKLIGGFDKRVDQKLELVSSLLSDLEGFKKGEVIELTTKHLPERSDKDKKRKRILILLIRSWKDLNSEVERVKNELESSEDKSLEQQVQSGAKITSFAKGPFGIITIIAAILAGIFIVVTNQSQNQTPQAIPENSPTNVKEKIQVINFNDKKIPLSELITGVGAECMSNSGQATHYHAKDHQAARAVDGSMVTDPGGCGFGRVDEVTILDY